jgi:hypothetical protein
MHNQRISLNISFPLECSSREAQGNMWVANSDYVDLPCPTPRSLGSATILRSPCFRAARKSPIRVRLSQAAASHSHGDFPSTATIPAECSTLRPFGLAQRQNYPDLHSRFWGVKTKKCPPGMKVGQPISSSKGYRSDAFERITAGQIDPLSNIRMTDNWRINANPVRNLAANALVIAIGAAGPLATPLIGPPDPF